MAVDKCYMIAYVSTGSQKSSFFSNSKSARIENPCKRMSLKERIFLKWLEEIIIISRTLRERYNDGDDPVIPALTRVSGTRRK